jgi:type II secretory pathway pseudopilin PulG
MLNFLKKSAVKKNKAETLLEVLIAIGMMAMAAATATELVVSCLQTITYNRDALVALNLAQEGVEYMRNLRDSNWIKYSSSTEKCWNLMPNATSCPSTPPSSADPDFVQDGKFYALGDVLGDDQTTDLDLSDGLPANNSNFVLKYFDLNSGFDSDGDDDEANDKDAIASSYSDTDATELFDTQYYRSVSVVYKISDSVGAISDPASIKEFNGNMMLVTSKVQWFGMGRVNTITLTSALSRYR